jgi:hypothetical protein
MRFHASTLSFHASQPTPSTSPNRLHSMSARLTLTVVVAGRRSSCQAPSWTWPGGLPRSIQEAQTADEEAARGS